MERVRAKFYAHKPWSLVVISLWLLFWNNFAMYRMHWKACGVLHLVKIRMLHGTKRHVFTCSQQHMCVPYVYEEMVGMQLVNRLSQRKHHTCSVWPYWVKSVPNPSPPHLTSQFSAVCSCLSYNQTILIIVLQGFLLLSLFQTELNRVVALVGK